MLVNTMAECPLFPDVRFSRTIGINDVGMALRLCLSLPVPFL